MSEYKYDPLQNSFTIYKAAEAPTKVEIDFPLMDKPLTLDGFTGVSESGTPVATRNIPQMINDNTEMQEITYTTEDSSTPNPGMTGDKKKAYEFFIGKGLKPHQAAGIVGNLIQESNLKTSIRGDGGKALGIAQWHPDRQKGLESLAKRLGTNKFDINTQLEYVWEELNTTEKRALDKLLQSKNVDQATSIFCQYYERAGKPMLESRIKHAKSLLS